MKKYFTLFLSILSLTVFGQLTSSFHYNLGLPQHSMANNINAVHQGVLSVGYRLPNYLQFMQVGADIGYGGYANLSLPTEFSFGNGRPTRTNVNYSSNTFVANGFLTLDLFRKGIISPYIMVKGGVQNFHSSIYIEDPTDVDGCQPLENENILSDQTMAFSYGGGFRYRLPTPVFMPCVKNQYIDVQILATRGGSLDYINTKKLTDYAQHQHNQQQNLSSDAKPLEMRFINVTSQVVHDHKIAEVYTTPLRLLDIKIGYYIEF
jgi:hypothetical protein